MISKKYFEKISCLINGCAEDRGDRFYRNAGLFLHDYMASLYWQGLCVERYLLPSAGSCYRN